MLVAMRLGFSTMDKTDSRLVSNRRVTNSRQIIENEISGFMHSMAYVHPKPGETSYVVFLQAESRQMRFVTSYSIDDAWRGRPQIALMQVIPGDRNEGVRLIVNEIPYTGPEQAGQQVSGIEQNPPGLPIIHYREVNAGSQSFVLADRLAYCRFSYLEPLYQPPFQIWKPEWVRPDILPKAVRIEMSPLEAKPGELHISTITVPISVTRPVATSYADYTPPPQQ
jgi:hypothetical protein